MGKLYICATPIGNLEDVSLRLLRILKEAELIACEDTRHTGVLLKHYEIRNRLISYHANSQDKREDHLIDLLKQGKSIALVSDAGMPGVSDPGQNLIRRAIEEGIDIEVVPGPSALTAALALSGFDSTRFVFEGFLSRREGKRRAHLEDLKAEKRTIIVYEAPHRLRETLQNLEEVMGVNRPVAVAREISKKFEEVIRGSLGEVRAYFEANLPRGEICLVIAGLTDEEKPEVNIILQEIEELIAQGMDKKEALKMKARQYKLPKAYLYKCLTDKSDKDM
ncbi:MAG: 16S rRNA (cytidine(1402)-2'-O)-methyltransferase [Syntrophomonas sp.]